MKHVHTVAIVYNRLLGGWFVVRGPHEAPLAGRFETKAEARAWLHNRAVSRARDFADRVRDFKERNSDGHY